ncbi:MAG: isopentenyl-diphosphate delta-isomerase [Pseudomonadota bacterium]
MTDLIPAWVDGVLKPYDKLKTHQLGLKHKAVSVFVMSGEDVLVQQRALSKYHTPGLWANSCCTHPAWGETPVDCAIRRLREELGITGLYPSHRDRIEYRADVGAGMIEHEVVDLFLADAPRDLTVSPNSDEVMATRWTDIYELSAEVARRPELFTPWLRIYLEEHRDRIFGRLVRA